MEYRYIDAHCHVQFDDYAHDQEDVIARMKENGIGGIVVGVDRASSERAVALAEAHEHLFAAVGVHPNLVGHEPFDADAFRALAAHPKTVAIGECGFDFYRTEPTDEAVAAERAAFLAHAALAAELDKPLIIHARPTKGTVDAYTTLIDAIKEAQAAHGSAVRGDVHFFVGGVHEAEALFALGFTVSFTAVITFARDYDAVIRTAPLDRILSETDAPYLSPAQRRRERNDPLAVEEVVRQIAEIRGEDLEAVRAALCANARRLFDI